MRQADNIYVETYRTIESNDTSVGTNQWQPKIQVTTELYGEFILFYSFELNNSCRVRLLVDGTLISAVSSRNYWVSQSGIKKLILDGETDFTLLFRRGRIRNVRLYINRVDF